MNQQPTLLWTPSEEFRKNSNLSKLMKWLAQQKGLAFTSYEALWNWSVENTDDFWKCLIEYFDLQYTGEVSRATDSDHMPGVRWFDSLQINYTEHIFRKRTNQWPAIIAANEQGRLEEISWQVVHDQSAALQAWLRAKGVGQGDRVAAYLPNIPEANIAFFATNSLGAIWSSCSPDFGAQAVIDRFAQIEPVVLIAVAGYHYGGKHFDKRAVVAEVVQRIPSIRHVILLGQENEAADFSFTGWQNVMSTPHGDLEFVRVGFNEPQWVLYSSGTTGLPKAITHSQGGVLLEQLKYLTFHKDVHPGERCFWFTTTGWMMWNHIQGCLLCGGTIVLYDGSPAFPDMRVLWKLAQDVHIHHFGTSAGFVLANMKEGIMPSAFDLSSLVSIGSTGSTLPPEGFSWIYANVKKDVWLTSVSGGTDVCSAFVGGNPLWPVYAGEIQCRALGCRLEVWDEDGHPIPMGGGEGEMVITRPMPSMPVFLWGDKDFVKYNESYFEMFPGTWRHGDWIELTPRHGVIIYGRSDATLNRDGVRIGTSEIYRAVDKVEEVKDSMIVCIERPGGKFYMPLFVMLRDGVALDDSLKQKINSTLRKEYSPRHVPDVILKVDDIPYTISGKKTETPVKKILMGRDPVKVVSRGSLRNPDSLRFFIDHYQQHLKS